MRMKLLTVALQHYREAFGRYPVSIEELLSARLDGRKLLDLEVLRDGWGNPIIVTLDPKGERFEILSMGADGKPNSRGRPADADLRISSLDRVDE